MSWIVSIIKALIGLFTGQKQRTEERLGAATAENKSLNAGIEAIQRAETAAREVREEHQANVEAGYDPDDLDDPRNAHKLRTDGGEGQADRRSH